MNEYSKYSIEGIGQYLYDLVKEGLSSDKITLRIQTSLNVYSYSKIYDIVSRYKDSRKGLEDAAKKIREIYDNELNPFSDTNNYLRGHDL